MSRKHNWWKYSEEKIEEAASEVSRGIPLLTASKLHGVPRTTLRRYIQNGKAKFKQMGPPPVLTKSEEETLVLWIESVARAGFPVTKDDLLDSVQKLLKTLGRENDFQDDRPGRTWYTSFLKRNPSISTRVAQNLTITRALVTSGCIRNWFEEVFLYLKEHNLDSVLKHPNRIYNADETAFFLHPKGNKVLAPKGTKTVYQQVNSNEKECITVLICANADGQLGPPLVVFKYERIPQELANSVPKEWGLGKSQNGWMTSELFFEYLSNVFDPWLTKNNIERPVILFVDGHTSHLTMHTSKFCCDHGIILVALYPNATHLIQPLDVAVFRSLKENWKTKVHDWRLRNTENPTLKKRDFSYLLKEVLDEKISPSIIRNGFRTCGLCPWNAEIPILKCTMEARPSTSHPCPNQIELKSAIKVVEKYIGEAKLNLFKQTSTWNGCEQDKGLFSLWHRIQDDICEECAVPLSPRIRLCDEGGSQTGELHNSNQVCDIYSDDHHNNNEFDQVSNPSTVAQQTETVPSPFKNSLFWPEKPAPRQRRRKTELVPSVVTSEKWQEHIEKKAKRKLELERVKEERKLERQKRKTEKEEMIRKRAEKRAAKKAKVGKKTQKKKRRRSFSSDEDDSWQPSGNSSDDISLDFMLI